uniref:NADH-ubiquinone oxidoreductase chain 2 n=1 Tax=Cnemaspis psychedelica TaxID=1521590 RepID=A0A0B4N2X4_9SAUR|nr:NADH dehydrogenase subunit 2 [Cnemaspis psychedelica]
MSPLTYTMLLMSLATSTIITMSSYHWLLAWLALELNTLSILPIIIKPHHPRATESTVKYFMIQTTAAAMILFASTLNTWQTGQWSITYSPTLISTLIITTAIMLKLGLVPVHTWYPEVLQGATLYTALILSTWQKIAPLALLFLMSPHLPNNMLMITGLLSALLGGWAGMNQTQTRKIMAFSSIAHMGWLMVALSLNQTLATLTLIIYIMMTTTIFSSMATTNTKTLTDITTIWTHSPALMTMMMLTLMSLGGLPPLTGFMPKWLILKDLTYWKLNIMALSLLMASLPSLFFYIRMAYLTILTTPPITACAKYKWRLNTNFNSNLMLLTMSAILLLPMMPILYNTM